MHPNLRTAGTLSPDRSGYLTLLTVAETAESAMSSTTSSPEAPVDARSTSEQPLEAGTSPPLTCDTLPFESPEFGVGGFFPQLDTPTDD